MFASVPRKDQRAKRDCYLRGLMLDGRRKSIGHGLAATGRRRTKNLQQFVNQSTRDPVPVQRQIYERMLPLISPDGLGDRRCVGTQGRKNAGRGGPAVLRDPGKTRQLPGRGQHVHAATDTASCPLQWRLFLPKEWASDTGRRTVTRVPPEVARREKWRGLALDMLDTLAGWGMRPPVVVADAAYGTNAHLRAGLAERGIDYVLAVRADVTAHPFEEQPVAPARNGPVGCWPQPRYRHPPPSVTALAAGLAQDAFRHRRLAERLARRVTVPLRRRAHPPCGQGRGASDPNRCFGRAGQGDGGPVPDCWLLVESARGPRLHRLLAVQPAG